jgi:uncharacterized protein YndB with AHSA1/START domain
VKPITTLHETVVVKRIVNASAARVFSAWREVEALNRWYVPGDGSWRTALISHDFRVGGTHVMTFGPPDDVPYKEDCRYEDIVTDQRICYAMTVSRGDARITTSMVTVEIISQGARTALTVTDQLVVLGDGDTAEGRERGWGETLDKLPAELARHAA